MERLKLFPITSQIINDRLTIAGHDLATLAEKFGTPLYLYDRATMDQAVTEYQSALRRNYPARSEITYAGKAFLCQAVAEWSRLHGLTLDCTGEAEVAIAVAGKATREKIIVHGVNKSSDDLRSALQHAGTIVVDNLSELQQIIKLASISGEETVFPNIWLRLNPGLKVETPHIHTQTGSPQSKFGMLPGELLEAAKLCRINRLPLNGIHFHQGSNFRDPAPLAKAIETGMEIARKIEWDGEWHFSPGGGWGVAYHEDELPQPDVNAYVKLICEHVIKSCKTRGMTFPILQLEPGRSLVAQAGVAIYRVGARKPRGEATWILVDGGMADNPRFALYGARYTCLPVNEPNRERTEITNIGGPFCESGDILIENLPMPRIEEGELIAIPVSGAYQLSMSSYYNGARRPAVVWLEEGSAHLIVQRETVENMLARGLGLK